VEKLAYEVWRTMAQLRIVGKGADLVVSVLAGSLQSLKR
jgi:hypothetical protein